MLVSASWIALGVAFLPVLAELARYFAASPHERSFVLAPLLIALCLRQPAPRPLASNRDGLLILVLAVALECIGIGTGTALIGRIALALGVVGMARWHGSPRLSVALLALGGIPVPTSAIEHTTPWLESLWGSAAAQFVQLLGGDVTQSGPLFRSSAGRLELLGSDGGLPLLCVLIEIAWYSGVRQAQPAREILRRIVLGAALAVPIQIIGIAIAVFILALGLPDAARLWLDHGLWLLIAICVIWRVERRTPSTEGGAEAHSAREV